MSAIRLVPFGSQHLDAVAELVHDPVTVRFTRIPEPVPEDFPARWQARYEQGRADGTREAFAIEDEEGAFLGLAMAPTIDREARTAELGYIVAASARGRGVATEALRALTDWAFERLDTERIELLIAVDNPASKTVAERCGYRREGVLRSVFFKQGMRQDTEIWSRLAGD